MAGEPVVRPLGFHYLAALVSVIFHVNPIFAVFYTGLFFSALTPVTVYFFAKRLAGRDSFGFLCAGFYGFNILDIEMLSWGGYPNIAGLALIPLVFYFFLGTSKRSRIVTALLIAALSIIDHSSFFVCVAALCFYVFFLLVRKGLREALAFATPILIGIVISAPYLTLYGMRIYVFTFITRQMSAAYPNIPDALDFLFLFMQRSLFFIPFLLIGILYSLSGQQKRFLLFWGVMPFILMLAFYLLGAHIPLGRLTYFLGQPIMVFTAFGSYAFFAVVKGYLQKLSYKQKVLSISWKRVSVAIALIIVTTLFVLQLQMFSQISAKIAGFYQIVREDEYEALKWIVGHTEESDVFVSGHAFGWWINGYAQRPCLCYIPLICINLPWQIQSSEDARKILYLREGYADLINQYGVKYVVLYFNDLFGLSRGNETEVLQQFQGSSDFQQAFTRSSDNSDIFIFEVKNHG